MKWTEIEMTMKKRQLRGMCFLNRPYPKWIAIFWTPFLLQSNNSIFKTYETFTFNSTAAVTACIFCIIIKRKTIKMILFCINRSYLYLVWNFHRLLLEFGIFLFRLLLFCTFMAHLFTFPFIGIFQMEIVIGKTVNLCRSKEPHRIDKKNCDRITNDEYCFFHMPFK